MSRQFNRNGFNDFSSFVSPRPEFGFRQSVGIMYNGHHIAVPNNNFGLNDIYVPIRRCGDGFGRFGGFRGF